MNPSDPELEQALEAAFPTCSVCDAPLTEARRYRDEWVYVTSCRECGEFVCEDCAVDVEYATDVASFTRCLRCVRCVEPGCTRSRQQLHPGAIDVARCKMHREQLLERIRQEAREALS